MAISKRNIRIGIIENLSVTDSVIVQRRPYTAVRITARFEDRYYEGVGFSKVNWPDPWDDHRGYLLAEFRAMKDIANQIMKEQEVV